MVFSSLLAGLTWPRAFLMAFWLVLTCGAAQAHGLNESYVYFDVTDEKLGGKIEVTVTELAKVLGKSDKVEAPLTQAEVEENFALFADYFGRNMQLTSQAGAHPLEFTGVTFLETESGLFAQLLFDVENLTDVPITIDMAYTALLGGIDPAHRGYALIATNSRTGMAENEAYISLVFAPGDGVQTLYLNDERTKQTAQTFLKHGIWKLWLGFDHVLFVIALLMSSVMVAHAGRWEPSDGLAGSLKQAAKIVIVFAVAHSITLGLATFGIVTLPAWLVEPVIALSIAVVACVILFPKLHTHLWILVFVLGLFHGFGLANALEPLGLDPARKVAGLVGFNIGVELAVIAIVFVVFPLFFAIREAPAYRRVVMQAGSVVLIVIAALWFAERTYGGFTTARVDLVRTV